MTANRRLMPDVADAIALAGFGLVLYGLWAMYRPAAFIVAGLVALWVALTLARRETKR